MAPVIKGKDVLNALNELKGPSKLDEIVDHLFPNYEGSKTALLETLKATLEAGVQHGYIEETENKYHIEYVKANANQNEPPQIQEAEEFNPKATSREAIKSVMSINDLHSSSESVITPRNKRIITRNLRSVSSDDDDNAELQDHSDCCGSRYRSSRRSRSRSGKRSKSHSRPRARRRRR